MKQFKNVSPEEAQQKLVELKKQLMKLKAQKSTGTNIKNPAQIRNIKRGIATLLQKISQKRG